MIRQSVWLTVLSGVAWLAASAYFAAASPPELTLIKPDVRVGVSNGGWKYDRYEDLPSLDANSRMTVADLQGPGVIRQIHITRHVPEQLTSRGVVLEIWFDDAEQPAVLSPLADFFGDGCNGQAMDFTSKFIECSPWNYNCYFPMPFRSRARVILRNDTANDIMNYSYVEFESLPEWTDQTGYFHATYGRKCFQLTKDSDEMFFEVQGTGHVVGRQFSIITDEPFFRGFNVVMEGNNEIDIDGKERVIDYLGTECSFGFCWGYRNTFAGLRCGIPLVENVKAGPDVPPDALSRLSVYRFHDQMPIRFKESLKWHINWRHEKYFAALPEWPKALERGGCWVDYATVHYWYQTTPGGFRQAPLQPVAERQRPMLRSASAPSAESGDG